MMDRFPLTAPAAFEDPKGDEEHHYITLFDDHPDI